MSELDTFMEMNIQGIPWMAETVENVPVSFTADISTLVVIESEVPWGETKTTKELEIYMSDIIDSDEDEVVEDGTHRVPFWALKPFQDCLKHLMKSTKKGKKLHTVDLIYNRTTFEKQDKQSGDMKTYNKANFAVPA